MAIKVFCDRCDLLMEIINNGRCNYQLSVHDMLLCNNCIQSFDALLADIRQDGEDKIKKWKKTEPNGEKNGKL